MIPVRERKTTLQLFRPECELPPASTTESCDAICFLKSLYIATSYFIPCHKLLRNWFNLQTCRRNVWRSTTVIRQTNTVRHIPLAHSQTKPVSSQHVFWPGMLDRHTCTVLSMLLQLNYEWKGFLHWEGIRSIQRTGNSIFCRHQWPFSYSKFVRVIHTVNTLSF